MNSLPFFLSPVSLLQPKCMNNAREMPIQAVYKTIKLLPSLLSTYKPLEEMSKHIKNTDIEHSM
jgi:hypothetical protein